MFTFLCIIIVIAIVLTVGAIAVLAADPNRGTLAAFLTALTLLAGAIIDLVRLP